MQAGSYRLVYFLLPVCYDKQKGGEYMRKRFALLLVILLVFFMQIPVSAASATYTLDELGLEVTIPSDYYVITRDTPKSDPVFSTLGVTREAVISQFEASSIYLNAVSRLSNEEIVVTMTTSPLDNFSTFSDASLETIASLLPSQFADYGIDISKYEIYQHDQAKFIKVYFTDSALTVHGLQFYTVYDGMAINFTMRSYTGSLSADQEKTIQKVVDSIIFASAPPLPSSQEENDPFVYTDQDSGVTFTVPANWREEEFTQDRKYIDAKFVAPGRTIIYGSTDLWKELPASERAGYSRADIDHSAFTKYDVAEMYDIPAHEISVVTYNGIRYYSFETTATADGSVLSVTMTNLIHINNGWIYTFQFSGTDQSKSYTDFESLLESVQYPTPSITATVPSPNTSPSSAENASAFFAALTAIGIVLILLGGIIAAITLIRKKAKKETSHSAPDENIRHIPSAKAVFCRKCGHALPSDSIFCHICGTKILPEDEIQ